MMIKVNQAKSIGLTTVLFLFSRSGILWTAGRQIYSPIRFKGRHAHEVITIRSTSCQHHSQPETNSEETVHEKPREKLKPEPGIWNVYQIKDANHCAIVPRWTGSKVQKSFWEDLGRWLADIDHGTDI